MEQKMSQEELNKTLQERFKTLPKPIQQAITSADVQKELRSLADMNKLHIDQWQLLENNVMLTLLGFQEPSELPESLQKDLDVSLELATSLAAEISKIVFEPIRGELERQLEHPEAKAEEVSGVEAARRQELAGASKAPATPAAPQIAPGTPPVVPPTEKAVRAPISEAYKAGEASTTRKAIADDPYREPIA